MTTRNNKTLYTGWRCLMLLLLATAVLNGCAAPRHTVQPPVPVTPSPPAAYKPVAGPAAALFSDAEKAVQSGRPAEAEMLLERALRIEPRNPHYWHSLAQVKFRQGQYREAVQFCLKSDSLAGKHPQLTARNKELQGQAKKAMATQ